MKILFCAPQHVSLLGETGGVLKLMQLYRRALGTADCEVSWLCSDAPPKWQELDCCHLFMANGDTYNLGARLARHLPLVVSPILDQLQSDALLRFNVLVDRLLPVVYTHLGRAAALMQLADRLCLMSRSEGDRVRRGLGVNTPADVALSPLPRLPERRSDSPPVCTLDRPYLLFVGDAGNRRKNVPSLIRATDEIGIDLRIAGPISPGPVGEEVERLAASRPRVEILGILEEGRKRELMEQASALVLPSLTEGIGFAALEAGALGTPVVITRRGGPPDYFGASAVLVDPGSETDLRRGIKLALEHAPDPRRELEERCRDEDCAVALRRCYERALSARSDGGAGSG